MTVARANRNIDRVLAGQDGAAESLSVLLQGAKAGLDAVVTDAAAVVLGYFCSGELHQYERREKVVNHMLCCCCPWEREASQNFL
jgi:hypothetical protein